MRRWITAFCAPKLAWCALLVLPASAALADRMLDRPLVLANRQPLVQAHALPGARSGAVFTAQQGEFRLGYDIANTFTSSRRSDESVELDGESQRVELAFTHGLGNGWEVGVALPWIRHSGGTLDGFIEDWHDTFGLPDGDRPDARRDQLRFRYARAGRTEIDFDDGASGIGDVRLNAAYSVLQTSDTSVALDLTVSLPTGDADRLTGAGATQVATTLAATRYALFGLPLTATGNVGALWLERGDVLSRIQRDVVWYGTAELGWAVADGARLKLQVNAHSAFYRSELDELGEPGVQLLLGGSVRLTPRWYLDVVVGEDIAVDTAPDVTFQIALKAAL